MTPAARTQAAIELLDAVLAAAREGGAAADTLVSRYFAGRRYAGSTDRRVVRDLLYAAIRQAGEPPASGRAGLVALADADPALAATFDGSHHGPAPIDPAEPRATVGSVPAWLSNRLVASGLETAAIEALVARAPLDLRVNRLKAGRADVRAQLPEASILTGLPDALRLPSGTPVARLPVVRDGWVEVQDAGSQAVTLAVPAAPDTLVVDLCAGAGGKTLALAAPMGSRGRIVACDTDRGRLGKLAPRAERAGVLIAETRLLNPRREAEALGDLVGQADAVLVDAPCSGTGTWRRNPEARWRITPDRLARLVDTQAMLLRLGATLVRPGGALVHVVCSVLDEEGAGQVDAFLAAHPAWRAEPIDLPVGQPRGRGQRLTPDRDGTDGFFVARLRAPC